jgi:Xaa-Pro aminopeptidase
MKSNEFTKRRNRLMRQMGKDALLILPASPTHLRNNDAEYPYRQNSDFFYLSGFPEPEALLVLAPGRKDGSFVLLCREKNDFLETWNGRMVGLDDAKKVYGADQSMSIEQADEVIPKLMANRSRVYYPLGADLEFDQRMLGWVNQVKQKIRAGITAPTELVSSDQLIHEMRLFKDTAEIRRMKKAAKISADAHIHAMRHCQPGMMEYEVEAKIQETFRANNCVPAYTSIVGSGANACILHYITNDAQTNDGDLMLIDAGAEFDNYAADITRTFPVNGKFSAAQKALYEIVLKAQLAAIKKIKPGNHWNQPHDAAVKVLTQGLLDLGLLKGDLKTQIEKGGYRKFYMHRTGHWLGMDVHDVGAYKVDGRWRKFEPGMVLTVEPGIYVAAGSKGVAKKWWNIGIRIEDDVLVTRNGSDVLSKGAPKTVDEIEQLMAKST